MTAYSLSSAICPVGTRGHRIVVTAVAGDKRHREEVAIDIVSTTWKRSVAGPSCSRSWKATCESAATTSSTAARTD